MCGSEPLGHSLPSACVQVYMSVFVCVCGWGGGGIGGDKSRVSAHRANYTCTHTVLCVVTHSLPLMTANSLQRAPDSRGGAVPAGGVTCCS